MLLSRSLRQSAELGKKVFDAYRTAGRGAIPPEAETKLALELSNGSRILCLPGGDEGAIRGFSGVRCLVLDEASRIPDALWVAVRPMISVSGGSMMLLSTPFGKRGFFYRVWSESERWLKIEIKADACPRLTKDFLAEELIELGERWYLQEYLRNSWKRWARCSLMPPLTRRSAMKFYRSLPRMRPTTACWWTFRRCLWGCDAVLLRS